MSPIRHEGDKKLPIESWGSHVDQMIRDAQARGEFDNLPGAGKPLKLEDSPFGAEWQSAFRMAKNAGAAPLWVQLDKEIGEDTDALQAMLVRTARYLEAQAARIMRAQPAPADDWPAPGGSDRPAISDRWWRPFRRRSGVGGRARPAAEPVPRRLAAPHTLEDLEAERVRARQLYLDKAAEVDKKILDYNAHRPRELTWLDKPRLLPQIAAQRFDAACPPLGGDHWPRRESAAENSSPRTPM